MSLEGAWNLIRLEWEFPPNPQLVVIEVGRLSLLGSRAEEPEEHTFSRRSQVVLEGAFLSHLVSVSV